MVKDDGSRFHKRYRDFCGVRLHSLKPGEKEVSIIPESDLSYYDSQSPDYIYNMLDEPMHRVLDVGCGIGKLGQRLKADNVKEVVGIEIDPQAAAVAEKHLDKVYAGDIETLDLLCPPGYFDVIVYSGVLEHLLDPYAELVRRRQFLREDGLVAALLPNVQHFSVVLELLAGRWTLQSAGQLDATHYRWFTLHEIRKMFDATGYAIEKCVGHIIDRFPPNYQKMIDLLKPHNLLSRNFEETTQIYIYTVTARKISDWHPSCRCPSNSITDTASISTSQSADVFTGERAMPLAPNMDEEIMKEHWARYNYVIPLAKGKRILDIACGSGYGADLLSGTARWVVGGDNESEAVKYSQSHYRRSNLHFGVMDVRDIPICDRSIDIITSFETLEHFIEGEQFLQEIIRLLSDDGTLFISTPFGGPVGNPYHVAYYQRGTIKAILHSFFDDVQLKYQRGEQFFDESLSLDYSPTFTGEYGLAICRKPRRREPKLTTIIILTLNQLEHTRKCLDSIEKYTTEPYELILVDNGSTDGTIDVLTDFAASRSNVRVVANSTNHGFAIGNNQGLALARGEYVLLLNNDTVVTEGWLDRMLHVLKRHPEVGIVGPVSNFVAGPQLVPKAPYKNMEEMHRFAAELAAKNSGKTSEIQRVVGFCLLARRALVDRIGGLDEKYGSGNFEDDDFCIRATMAGFKSYIARDVFIHHAGSMTFKGEGIDYRRNMERNWRLFKAKWNIPAYLPLAKGYRMPRQPTDMSRYFIPVTYKNDLENHRSIGSDHRLQEEKSSDNRDSAESSLLSSSEDIEKAHVDITAAQSANEQGKRLSEEGKEEGAIQEFLRATNLAPGWGEPWSNLAVISWNRKDYGNALQFLTLGLKADPDCLDLIVNYAMISDQLDQKAQAVKYLKKYLERHPGEKEITQILNELQHV